MLRSLFPYPGGKSRIIEQVHGRMGRVTNRVEPFAGTAVWMLSAPPNGSTETINDADGFITNCYRAIREDPDTVARWVSWPVSELDLHARHRWLIAQREGLERRLRDDPIYYDPQVAGWWLWGIAQWIGDGWCPRIDGTTAPYNKIPHLGDAGMGVHRPSEQIPHLGNAGMGVHRPSEQIPHLGDAGMGVHRQSRQHTGDGTDVHRLLHQYSSRLRHMRITCGDWRRVLGPSVTERHGMTAIFLDPPYPDTAMGYSGGPADVWHDARRWAIDNGDNPLLRIALCGYDFDMPAGWSLLRWKTRGGYGSQGDGAGRANAKRECIWFSPACIGAAQRTMFDDEG